MSKMISVAPGFQYSVNIVYDLYNDDKLKNFIPTKLSLTLLEDILLSTEPSSNERARMLVGAYGRGKSYIVLVILAILMKRNIKLFKNLMPQIKKDPRIRETVGNYYSNKGKLFPIIITGSNISLSQAFLLALHRALSEAGLMHIMPDTNYNAAINTILKWKQKFPDTYKRLEALIGMPANKILDQLSDYNILIYEQFEKAYSQLTSGSVFNPFIGFDVVDLYEEAVRGLQSEGYSGIYLIYDEFSKYLESNIADASVSDTKMLQDFAEKCNRSGNLQMHILLILHKEISNYIDKLPKQKIDGWRGVSDRFKHIDLNNSFTQTYEIIESAIQKDAKNWKNFCNKFKINFGGLLQRYKRHNMFGDIPEKQIEKIIYGCYPLHPVSTFILPRLSELVAQNERTLFTFISAHGNFTLPTFLSDYHDDFFELITPDQIYDYFSPLLQKEVYGGTIHENYALTESILNKLKDRNSLESKIIKTLSLIYILEQFEKLKPTEDELIGVFSINYEPTLIRKAIEKLRDKEYVVYLERNNKFLKLKRSSGIDIQKAINDTISAQKRSIEVKDILNKSNFDNYIYPSRYNGEHDMIRYFSFKFIDEDEVTDDIDWNLKSEYIDADGVIYGIIPHSQESIGRIKKILLRSSKNCERMIFIIPRKYIAIEDIVREYSAVTLLRKSVGEDVMLFDEYEVVYEDLSKIIGTFMRGYTHPEEYKSMYIYEGKEKMIRRKAALTSLMSNICDRIYYLTPVISNEAINKNEITSIANNSRAKIIAALLRNKLEPNLGFTGSGQEVSIMRSVLIRTGIWEENNGIQILNLHPNNNKNISYTIKIIEDFIKETRYNGAISLKILYKRLTSPEYHIGLRKGLIPIYLAVVIHKYKKEIVISNEVGDVPISSDLMLQINAKPEIFSMSYFDWDSGKEVFVRALGECFSAYIVEAEKDDSSYDYVVTAMRRWYLTLPKYVKESKISPSGEIIQKQYREMLHLLKQNMSGNEFLFDKLPKVFGYSVFNEALQDDIAAAKNFYDVYLNEVKKDLIEKVKRIFALSSDEKQLRRMSLASVIRDWCESLDSAIFEQLFENGTDRCLYLFHTITNDDNYTILKLARIATDLRLEDWDEGIRKLFYENIKNYKKTAEAYHSANRSDNVVQGIDKYLISFANEGGEAITKRFSKVDYSPKGKLLKNQIISALSSMGRSMTDQEKRQVLMEVLRSLCQ
jgi:hypothetical protein